ncbi:MAG TPA: HAD family phosphatase [Pirellulales bacterium]|jgi:FMN phosphatase YigB (HAD superfamily)
MAPKFIYFDLGNVLVYFDHWIACRQMAQVAGLSPERVWQVVFESDLEHRYESGQVDDRGFYDAFCTATGTQPDYGQMLIAGSDIFRLNHSILPVIAQIDGAGHRLGILSNTSPAHWAWVTAGRFGIINLAFDQAALSYEIGACKPEPKIYAAAAELAGAQPDEIFFVDDMPENVAAARQAGFDAVEYTTTPLLVAALRERGVDFNY